jgi:hypothetical protein
MKKRYNVSVFGETDSYFAVELDEKELSIIENFLDYMMKEISPWDAINVHFEEEK